MGTILANTESESHVLPLHHSTNIIIFFLVFLILAVLFSFPTYHIPMLLLIMVSIQCNPELDNRTIFILSLLQST